MTSFSSYLSKADLLALKDYLDNMREPVWECELIRVTFADADLISGSALEMYRWHFVLFHLLYLLVPEYAEQNRYLHIHFMRTCLRDYPAAGRCRHFDDEQAEFCAAPCRNDELLCDFHLARIDDTGIDRLSDRYFYLDPANFTALSAENAEKFMAGAWKLLQNYEEYRRCLAILDLPEGVSIDVLKKRFRYLARTMHPDITAGHHEEFSKINTAYRNLLNWLSAG
ncbi:MAG: DnaJ domain-containing protein [Candidatus Riflebacteria bacterium]|nr:DnaJ domain-containing protein [Candidatus Riflebacteria bacterium]